MDESVNRWIEGTKMKHALEEIRDIAEDHIDYDTPGWHQVLKLAREALGER